MSGGFSKLAGRQGAGAKGKVMAKAACAEARGRRIAVVDDDRNMALLLAYNIEMSGYLVAVIASGAGAVDELERAEPDLIILDWELPGLSGIEVLRQFRLRCSPRRTPIIMLTGRTDRDDRIRAIGNGADLFISKPFAMSDLMQSIAGLIGRETVD